QHITGIRLETLHHHSLPGHAGPGRSSNGAAMVSELQVAAAPARLDHELDSQSAEQLAAAWTATPTSLYLRIPFHVADPAALTGLELQLRYLDGFVAYVNGQRSAISNMTGDVVQFDSRALAPRNAGEALDYASFDLSQALPLLQTGDNLLALQLTGNVAAEEVLMAAPRLFGYAHPSQVVVGETTIQARALVDGQWSALSELELTTFGDFNNDLVIDVRDIELLCLAIRRQDTTHDLTGDQQVSPDDVNFLVNVGLGTSLGDANLDGRFDSRDLVLIFQRGEYEDAIDANSTWSDGDWNCDGEFTTSDLVIAFQFGSYVV
ncbi:MAG: hypothetical protein KDA92_23750, partial [Planctomycetales bacterium]|nr:hypothetical protein [Planctomycetales bacterium]